MSLAKIQILGLFGPPLKKWHYVYVLQIICIFILWAAKFLFHFLVLRPNYDFPFFFYWNRLPRLHLLQFTVFRWESLFHACQLVCLLQYYKLPLFLQIGTCTMLFFQPLKATMIGQLQFIAKYDLMILVTSSWSLSREALTWCEPSHFVSKKTYRSRCETCTCKFVYIFDNRIKNIEFLWHEICICITKRHYYKGWMVNKWSMIFTLLKP